MQDPALCCTTTTAIGHKAFNNYNGIGISVCYSPQPPSAVQQAAASWSSISQSRSGMQMQPPPMLAVVLDTSMDDSCLQAAIQALTQALSQLNPQTRLLLVLVDQVVTMLDLKSPRAQTWVVHGSGGPAATTLPQIVRAADIRATPLAHCESFLAHSLSTIRHYPRHQSLQHHLTITTSAMDIALFLLTASMAAWDVQHRPPQQQQQQHPRGSAPSQQQAGGEPAVDPQPLHNARIMLMTSLPSSSTANAATAAQLLQQLEPLQAQTLQQMVSGLSAKAFSLDIPLDVITGSLAAPAALLLQEAVTASHGRLLYQPQLQPPLASNIAAVAQSRFGWEGVIDFRVPPGIKVAQLSGPVAPSQALPKAAYLSGTLDLPVLLVGARGAAAAASSVASAADASAAADGVQQAAAGSSSSPLKQAAADGGAAAGDGSIPAPAAAAAAAGHGLAGPISWSAAATTVPVVSSGTRFVAALELSKDWQPGSSFEVQVVCEWTGADGRRARQVCSHTVQVSDRLSPFLDGLDVPAVVLLMAQRLVAGAATTAAPPAPGGSTLLCLAATPKPRAVEEGRLSVGMALAHVAQRLGHAHTAKRGIFGFGAQQVWELPEDLIPMALSLYQLQRGSLLNPSLLIPESWELPPPALDPADPAAVAAATAAAAEAAARKPAAKAGSSSSSAGTSSLMYGSWRVLVQQFLQTSPSAALRMVAPWLYVFDSSSSQFEVLPPLNLALEPDALAVLDCGSEVIIYVGRVLEAMVEGLIPIKHAGRNNSQQQQQQQGSSAASAGGVAPGSQPVELAADAAAQQPPAANGIQPSAAAAAAVGSLTPPANAAPTAGVPDIAVAAAPAVQCAQQLVRGRIPVPAIKLVEDPDGMVQLVKRLVPLHDDPVALQLLLLPHLRDLSPAQHGYLLDWHRHWAACAALQGGSASAAGGARLVAAETGSKELSFGQWYSSFGVVLRSPAGTMGSDGHTLD